MPIRLERECRENLPVMHSRHRQLPPQLVRLFMLVDGLAADRRFPAKRSSQRPRFSDNAKACIGCCQEDSERNRGKGFSGSPASDRSRVGHFSADSDNKVPHRWARRPVPKACCHGAAHAFAARTVSMILQVPKGRESIARERSTAGGCIFMGRGCGAGKVLYHAVTG